MQIRNGLFAGVVLVVAACEGPLMVEPAPEISISVSASPTQLVVGQTVTAIATVEGASNPAVVWRSSAPAVATVNVNTGVITAVAPGIAAISAMSIQDTTRKAGVVITVVPGVVLPIATIAPSVMNLPVGAKATFVSQGFAGGIMWRTSAVSIATIASTGEVTGVAAGEAVISAISVQDTTKRATAIVRVGMISAPD